MAKVEIEPATLERERARAGSEMVTHGRDQGATHNGSQIKYKLKERREGKGGAGEYKASRAAARSSGLGVGRARRGIPSSCLIRVALLRRLFFSI